MRILQELAQADSQSHHVVTVVYCLGHDQTARHKTCTQTYLTHRNHRLKLQNPETGHRSTSSSGHVPGYKYICSITYYSPSSCSEQNTLFFCITFYITFPSNLIGTYVYNDLYSASTKSIYFYDLKRKKIYTQALTKSPQHANNRFE